MTQKFVKIIFKQGFQQGSLSLCSQTILCEFVAEYEAKDNDEDKISSYIFKDKFTTIVNILLS